MDEPKYETMSGDDLRDSFLHAADGPREGQDDFFSQFKYVQDILGSNPGNGVDQGLHLLNSCLTFNPGAYEHIHKGSAYYWLGIGAFRVHDHELAAFFFDAAVSEDIRAGADPLSNPTPALRFIQIEGEPKEQAARDLVKLTEARVQELMNNYNARAKGSGSSPPFEMSDLRQQFLRPAVRPGREAWRSLATAFISFSLEWDYRNTLLDLRPCEGTSEPILLHLFKGCVLFESLLKTNPSSPIPQDVRTLGRVLNHLHSELEIPPDLQVGRTTLPQTINDLDAADEAIETAIVFTSRIRNTVGHNLGWVVSFDKIQYSRLFRMISSSCLHAIACLYR